MAGSAGAPAHAISADGTPIAFWTSGAGPPLLLVHGTAGVHERFAPLLPHLEPHAAVHVLDRRGRGASGDAPAYALEREHEDVAAVVDRIAELAGERVDVYGHSYGGECAFGAALLTPNVRSLALYEGWPPVRPELLSFPAELERRLENLIAAGEREAAMVAFMRELVGATEAEVDAVRSQPTWAARVASVHTIAREVRAFRADRFDEARAARIAVPVLVLTGAESPPEIRDDPERVAAVLPDARLAAIEGQGHLADVLAPEAFAALLLGFLRERP